MLPLSPAEGCFFFAISAENAHNPLTLVQNSTEMRRILSKAISSRSVTSAPYSCDPYPAQRPTGGADFHVDFLS